MVTLRAAAFEDAAAIAHVHVESWRSAYRDIVPAAALAHLNEAARTTQWQEWLGQSIYEVQVAALPGGKIIGFAAAGPTREPDEKTKSYDAELYALYLLPQHQGQGTGRALTHSIARALVARNFQAMLAWVLQGNAAIGFYQHLGAQPVTTGSVEMAGTPCATIALGWPSLAALVR